VKAGGWEAQGALGLRLGGREAGKQSACAEVNTRGIGQRAKGKREHCTPVEGQRPGGFDSGVIR